jgi:dTDP-4-dehydrorhamnose reductase
LTNATAASWAALAFKTCEMAGVDASRQEVRPATSMANPAAWSAYSALGSERGILLPALDDALERYLRARADAEEEDCPWHESGYGAGG